MHCYDPAQPRPDAFVRDRKKISQNSVSVVVPAHNDEVYIEACVRSLMEQSVKPYEIIICDDDSQDRTRDIARNLAALYPGWIRCIFHDENVGCGSNFNSGIRAARGHYVSIVAADDYWLPEKLGHELEAVRENNVRWAYSAVELAWEDGPHAGQKAPFWGTRHGHSGELFEDILLRRISPRNFLIERELLLESGGFDEAFGMYEDWDLKLRLSARFPAAFVAETGIVYRQHGQGISRSDPRRQLAEAGKVLRKNRKLVEQYDAENAVALRDLAWQNLLPGTRTVMEVPASLSMDFVPRRLNRRGDGLIILPAGMQGALQDALQPHPDLLVSSSLPVDRVVWTGLLANVQNDPVAQGAARAAFYAAWRKQLVESGRSRLLQCAKLAPGEVECLYRIFPAAKFIVNDQGDIPASVADCSRFIVVGQIADDSLPVSLYEALELPPLACPDPAQLIAQGEQYFAMGDLAAAEASFREALRLDACAPDAYNNLAVVCWQRGDLAAALDLLSQGLVLDSRHLDLLENSARILLDTGYRDDAEKLCNQYLAINPGNKEMTALLALTRHAVG